MKSNKTSSDGDDLGAAGIAAQTGRYRRGHTAAERRVLIVDEHTVVGVEVGEAVASVHVLAADDDGLLLLALDGEQDLVADVAHASLVVHVNDLGRSLVVHSFFEQQKKIGKAVMNE